VSPIFFKKSEIHNKFHKQKNQEENDFKNRRKLCIAPRKARHLKKIPGSNL
jgi:hypothetical protein